MNEHYAEQLAAGVGVDTTTEVDGEAISRADKEFLASLGDHPLTRHPLYGVSCPPRPSQPGLDDRAQQAAQTAAFATAVDWLLVNYAYREGAFMGKGGAISLVDGEIITLADLHGRMAPWELLIIGPRGGIKTRSPVDDWRTARARRSIRREEMRPDRPRPTFTEDGYHIFNRYRPPTHPAEGGDIAAFETFFARLFPDDAERTWCWHWLAHKTRRPWVPMVGFIMVAEEFGTGRGTLFEILELLFGKDYVAPCTFGELTGTSAAARFNARLADALFAVVNEAVAEDGHQQAQRRLHYDVLKNVVDPSPTQRRRYEAKQQHAYAQRAAMSVIIATQHRDVVKLLPDDRRFEVLTCGRKMTPAERADIRAWMAEAKNIGALYRALLATAAAPLDVFDPFGVPPPFAGRLEMIGMGRSKLEDAYDATIEALEGCPLFTMPQAQRLISYIVGGVYAGGGDSERARHTVAKNAYRLRQRDEPDNRIRYRKRREVIYARTGPERQRWRAADTALIVKQLDRAEERIVQVINAERDVLADLLRGRSDDPLPESGG
jgi:uncharacterized protein DUF5906